MDVGVHLHRAVGHPLAWKNGKTGVDAERLIFVMSCIGACFLEAAIRMKEQRLKQ